jgi:hypothetical protein
MFLNKRSLVMIDAENFKPFLSILIRRALKREGGIKRNQRKFIKELTHFLTNKTPTF